MEIPLVAAIIYGFIWLRPIGSPERLRFFVCDTFYGYVFEPCFPDGDSREKATHASDEMSLNIMRTAGLGTEHFMIMRRVLIGR